MIKLAFIGPQRKIIKFEIENRIVTYFDDIWKEGIQIMPKNQNLIERLRRSGKHNLKMMAALILDANKGGNFEEYQKCTNDEDVSKIIIKDCKSKGLIEVK
jgi:hypothetical protein